MLLDDWATVETHSILFDHVKNTLGHEIEYEMTGQSTGRVRPGDGLSKVDNIILLAPTSKEAVQNAAFEADKLTGLLEDGDHNLLVFGGAESSSFQVRN